MKIAELMDRLFELKEDNQTGTQHQLFRKEILSGRDFSGQDLLGSNFTDAVLYDCDFRKATLCFCNFKGAKTQGSNFKGANVYGCPDYEKFVPEDQLNDVITTAPEWIQEMEEIDRQLKEIEITPK